MRPAGVFRPRDFVVKNWTSSGLCGQKAGIAGFDFINMPAGFMIPARHVPPLMARHTKAGYTTSSGLSLAQVGAYSKLSVLHHIWIFSLKYILIFPF